MFELDADDSNDDVQEAVSISEGDHCIAPDGREWVVVEGLAKTMGETFTILEAADQSGEQCGVTSVSEFCEEWEVLD
jgi:hypothetical protein